MIIGTIALQQDVTQHADWPNIGTKIWFEACHNFGCVEYHIVILLFVPEIVRVSDSAGVNHFDEECVRVYLYDVRTDVHVYEAKWVELAH